MEHLPTSVPANNSQPAFEVLNSLQYLMLLYFNAVATKDGADWRSAKKGRCAPLTDTYRGLLPPRNIRNVFWARTFVMKVLRPKMNLEMKSSFILFFPTSFNDNTDLVTNC